MTNSFLHVTSTSGEYLWSNPDNWTHGVPVDGSNVSFRVHGSTPRHPGGFDDIDNLSLDRLTIHKGYLAVGGDLTIGTLAFSGWHNGGIEADTLLTGGTATVVIDGLTRWSHGLIGAEGANATTTVQALKDYGETYRVDRGGEVVLDADPNRHSSFTFRDSGHAPSGTFAFESPGGTISSRLAGVAVGDSIALPGTEVDSVTFGAHSMTVVTDLGTTTFTDVSYGWAEPAGYTVSTDPTGLERITFTSVACFLAGTEIMTRRGEVAVEALTEQDEVLTQSGRYRPVRWIGHRAIDTLEHSEPNAVLPIRVVRDAFAPGVPARDLWLSPDHAVWTDGVLVPVRLLINGATILRDRSVLRPVYYHVALDRHDILFANGMPAESYLDTGNHAFDLDGVPAMLHSDGPEFDSQAEREAGSCAQLVCTAAGVRPIWQALASRAGVLGLRLPNIETTDDPALGIVADGRLHRPLTVSDGHFIFQIPKLRGDGRLVSRAASPCDLTPWVDDRRRLGVAVRHIAYRCGDQHGDLAMDDTSLADGWWETERNGAALWRWSDGDARLPVDGNEVVIEVWVGATLGYPVADLQAVQSRLAA